MPPVIHFHRELRSAVLHIGSMWLTKLYLLGLLSFQFLTLSGGQKLTCAKDESKANQQSGMSQAEINKLPPIGYSLTDNKPKISFVFSVKPKDKTARKLSENNENIEAIREKLMKTLLENGDVKNVNSLGLNSEEAINRNHVESKHEEVWALMDEIIKRKNFLRKEIEELYKRGLPKTHKRYEPEDSEQTDANSGEDYSEENLSNEGKESESDETPNEGVSFGRRHRKDKKQRNYKAAPILKMPKSEMSKKVKSPKFPKTEKYPEEAAAVVEDASDEETNIKRNENELRNRNMQLSKLFIQQMKEIYDMENKSRKAQRAKRHYESQIPFPYELSQESESVESVEKIQRRSSKKRPAIKKKFYIIDNDPLGFYYYFKHSQMRDPSPVKFFPAVELTNTKISKKKSSKKRIQQLKKKRLPKKKRRYEKEGILIKQIEENHSNDLRNSANSENLLLPQSTQLQAKYLYQNRNKMKWNKKDRPIPNSEFGDFDDFDDFENRENMLHNRNSIEYEPTQQQILKNDLSSEDKFICAPLEPTTEPNMIISNQKKNETEIAPLSPENVISNSTTNQFEDPKLQQSIEDQQNLADAPKIRVPRSYRPTTFRAHLDAGGDCSEFCSSECEQKYEPHDDPNWDELNLYLSLFKKLFEDKSLEDILSEPTTTESTTTTATTTESETTITDAENDSVDAATCQSSTTASTTPFVVSPGNYGLNLNQIAEEINEAVASENSDTIVPFEEPPVGSPDLSQPTKKNEQSLLLKRPQGFWLPLKLVQNIDGKFNIQLDLKYICRRCTKQKQKRKRKQQKRDSTEIY